MNYRTKKCVNIHGPSTFSSVKYTRYLNKIGYLIFLHKFINNKVILTKFQHISIAMCKVGGSRNKAGIVQQLCHIEHVYCQLNT